jgi:hypothetical protein
MRILRWPVPARVSQSIGLLAIGVGCGALSWVVAFAVSGRFEPYDSSTGLAANQIVLCLPAILLACKPRLALLLFYFFGVWLGMNTYAYAFGGSEQRAWAMLGAVTSLLLLFWPVVLAVVTIVIRYIWSQSGAARGLHSEHKK